MKIKLLLSAFFILALNAGLLFGQTSALKIGYTDPEYIIQHLPEYKQIESELRSYEKQLQAQIDTKMKDYQTKLEAYQQMISNPNGVPDVVRQDKEKELLAMQSNIKEFEENALSSLQKKQAQSLDPLAKKVEEAIEVVAKENGYTYIFSSAAGTASIILYAKNKDEDVSALVLKKLGVSAPVDGAETGIHSTTPATGTTGTTGTGGTGTGTGGGTNTNSTAPVKKK